MVKLQSTLLGLVMMGFVAKGYAAADPKDKMQPVKTDSAKVAVKKDSVINRPATAAIKLPATVTPQPQVKKQIEINRSVIQSPKVWDYLMDYISAYTSNNGEHLVRLNSTKESSFKLIENVLTTHGVPTQLKYLAVIESGLNGNAVSPVGAVGYWQFMDGTARLMGLNVSPRKDDRRDLYKSTNAAAKYLKQLYGMFDDWLLVIAAYNSGPSPVLRAIKNTGSSSFWDIKKYLPRETQGHVMAFLATAAIMEKLGNFMGLSNMPLPANLTQAPAATDEYTPSLTKQELESIAIVKVQGPYRLDVIARMLETDVNLLKKWNPKFNEVMLNQPDFVYKLRIPKDKLEQFIDQRPVIYAESCTTYKKEGVNLQAKANTGKHKVYTVQEGDNIDRIAMRFGKSIDELRVLNATRNLDAVPGALIRIE